MPKTVEMDNQTQEILEAARILRLAEQEILRESLKEKSERIRELEAQVRFLKDLLSHWQAAPRPQTQPSPKLRDVPRRWKIKT